MGPTSKERGRCREWKGRQAGEGSGGRGRGEGRGIF